MPANENRGDVVDRLVQLIDEMAPFLDTFGRAYCQMPHTEKAKQGQYPLNSQPPRSLLFYRYKNNHGGYPGRERVSEAIEYVEGRLLHDRKVAVVQTECPVLRCFMRGTEDEGSGADSAAGILRWLREINRQHKLLNGAEKLPKNATTMGKWLVNNVLLLRAKGIELFRPERRSAKRSWGWQKIVRDDATDTSVAEVSQGASCPNSKEENEKQQNDTLTDAQLNELLPKQ